MGGHVLVRCPFFNMSMVFTHITDAIYRYISATANSQATVANATVDSISYVCKYHGPIKESTVD